MTPFEGKVWKANVVVKEGSNEQWTLPFFEKVLMKLLHLLAV